MSDPIAVDHGRERTNSVMASEPATRANRATLWFEYPDTKGCSTPDAHRFARPALAMTSYRGSAQTFARAALIVLALLVLSFQLLHAGSRVDCATLASKALGKAVPYCVMLPPGYDAEPQRRFPVLYYLHGLGDNEQTMVNSGAWNLYLDLVGQRKAGEFIIVNPAGYRTFYVNSADGKVRYEDFFIREFLPAIERKYRVLPGRAHRGLLGVSMGGYGAFHMAFRYPQLFGSVSTLMAALRESPPPDFRAGGNQREEDLASAVFGEPFNLAYYKAQSPFTLARTAPVEELRRTAIYFDCGSDDHYGFAEGARAMDKLLTRLGVKHEAHVDPGGHDVKFVMQHFAAALEFESHAFGLTAAGQGR